MNTTNLFRNIVATVGLAASSSSLVASPSDSNQPANELSCYEMPAREKALSDLNDQVPGQFSSSTIIVIDQESLTRYLQLKEFDRQLAALSPEQKADIRKEAELFLGSIVNKKDFTEQDANNIISHLNGASATPETYVSTQKLAQILPEEISYSNAQALSAIYLGYTASAAWGLFTVLMSAFCVLALRGKNSPTLNKVCAVAGLLALSSSGVHLYHLSKATDSQSGIQSTYQAFELNYLSRSE